MPLNRPALSLGAGPRGVQDARRWVVGTFRDIGRDDLVECAEMAVSEVVTNALLHGAPPIQVRVRGTREHPRVEVSDGSQEAADAAVGRARPRLDRRRRARRPRRPAADLRPRPEHRGPRLRRLGRRDRGRRQDRLVHPGRRVLRPRRRRGPDHRRPPPATATGEQPGRPGQVRAGRRPGARLRLLPQPLPRAAPRGAAAGDGQRGRLPAGPRPRRGLRPPRPAADPGQRAQRDRPGPRGRRGRPPTSRC